MHRTRLAALAALPLIAVGALSACSTPQATPEPAAATTRAAGGDATSLLESQGLAGKSGRDVVETLDRSDQQRPLAVGASVRYDEVLISDGETEAVVPIEGDEFYLSLAPYETRTHDCYFHNLGSCQGELVDTDVHVTITTDDGDVLVDQDATTYANGFAGFWVPKDVTGTIIVTKDGKTAESPFSSDAEGATCVTTLHLS